MVQKIWRRLFSQVLVGQVSERSPRLPGQREQVAVAAHQNVGPAAPRKVEKRLIVRVPALDRALLRRLDGFAVRKVVRQQFYSVVVGQAKFGIAENSPDLKFSRTTCNWRATPFSPMLPKPGKVPG